MRILFSIIIGYLLGSIPTAYLITTRIGNTNLLREGSKSVGALNAYRVSGSFIIFLIVFILDFLKGVAAIFLIGNMFDTSFELLAITSIFVVLGHSFSVWLKFKGGKGIAVSAGLLIMLAPYVLIIWSILWLAGFIYKKNAHIANILASVLTAILCFTSADILMKYSRQLPNSNMHYSILMSTIFMIILVNHRETIFNYFSKSDK